jgi:hypothetical protein
MARKRFVVEAEWCGYTSSQTRIVHRTVETTFRAGFENIGHHTFGDGTTLFVTVRDAKPRERVHQNFGYKKLLDELAWRKWVEIRDSTAQNSGDAK